MRLLRRLWPFSARATSTQARGSTADSYHERGMIDPNEQAPQAVIRWASNWATVINLVEEIFPGPDSDYTLPRDYDGDEQYLGDYYNALRDGFVFAANESALDAIASSRGFGTSLWHRPLSWWQTLATELNSGTDFDTAMNQQEQAYKDTFQARKLNQLFDGFPDPETGELHTNDEVVQASNGLLSAERLQDIRNGHKPRPSRAELEVFCEFFSISPAYWVEEEAVPSADPRLLYSIAEGGLLSSKPQMLTVLFNHYHEAERVLMRTDHKQAV